MRGLSKIRAYLFFSRSRNFDLTAGQLKGWKRYLPIPREAIEVPRYVTNGLFQSRYVLEPQDIDPAAVYAYRDYITHLMRWQGKNRFLHKHQDLPARTFSISSIPTVSLSRLSETAGPLPIR